MSVNCIGHVIDATSLLIGDCTIREYLCTITKFNSHSVLLLLKGWPSEEYSIASHFYFLYINQAMRISTEKCSSDTCQDKITLF